jgi:hypothetical protein
MERRVQWITVDNNGTKKKNPAVRRDFSRS